MRTGGAPVGNAGLLSRSKLGSGDRFRKLYGVSTYLGLTG